MDWITSIKEIQKAQENNQLVIFVGAGVSKNSNVPTWWELIKKIADEIGYNKCDACKKKTEICPQDNCEDRYAFTQDEFLRIPEYYYQQDTSGDKSNYYNLIQSTLRGGTGPNPIDDEIFNILPHHIITTNYDPWLESSNAINSRLYTVVSQDSDLLANASERYIIKMHGDLELPDTIVLKESDYIDYEQKHPLISTFIRSLLVNHTFLFLGYSLNDYNLNLIIGWINYFRKFHGVEHRPSNFLIDFKTPTPFEQARLEDRSIFIVDLSSLPVDLEEKVEVPTSLTDPVGRSLFSYLHCITNSKDLHDYIPLEDRLLEKYQMLAPYSKISYQDLMRVHPLGHSEFMSTELVLYDKDWYNRLCEILDNEYSPVVEVFRRAGISAIHSHSDDSSKLVPPSLELETDYRLFQLYLDNNYIELKNILDSCPDTAQKIYYSHLLVEEPCKIDALLKIDAESALGNGYISILLHKVRNRIATLTPMNRQESKTRELEQLFDTSPIRCRNAITYLQMLFESPDKNIQKMAMLLEEHEKRYKYHSNTWFSGHAHINIWKLKSFAYDYYFFFKENGIPLDYYTDPKKYLSYYLKSILCSYSPVKSHAEDTMFGVATDHQRYPIGEIELDMFIKYSDSKSLLSWIKKYSVQKLEVEPNIDVAEKFANLCISFVEQKVVFWIEQIYCFSIIICLLDLDNKDKLRIIDAVATSIEHASKSDPAIGDNLFKVVNHLIQHLNVTNAAKESERLINALLDKNIYSLLINHHGDSFMQVTKKMSNYLSGSTINSFTTQVSLIQDPIVKTRQFYYLRFILPHEISSEYFSTHLDDLTIDQLFYLLLEKRIPFSHKCYQRFIDTINEQDEIRKNRPGYRTFPDLLTNTIDRSIILKLVGFDIDLSMLQPYSHYSKPLQFMLAPENFDYTTIDTNHYMWQNLIFSEQYQKHFIEHKQEILSENLKEAFSLGVETVHQQKIVYGIFLSGDELRRF